jgi:hypothetical protein
MSFKKDMSANNGVVSVEYGYHAYILLIPFFKNYVILGKGIVYVVKKQ